MGTSPLRRANQLTAKTEAWKPPTYSQVRTPLQRAAASARRFLDLQAASIWKDMSVLLPPLHGDVLDVGSGAQPYRGLFAAGVRYRAIDSATADDDFGYAVPDTTYYHGVRWPVDTDSIDAILCTETLEHVPDTAQFLGEAARCLRPGGVLILTVPFAARWHYIPHDYWRFTPSALGRVLHAAGFINIQVFARGNAVTVACYKVMALFLPLLIGRPGSAAVRYGGHVVGVISLPLLVVLACAAQASMAFDGGADCLGYTVCAARPADTGATGAQA